MQQKNILIAFMKNADKTELENFAETNSHLAIEWHPIKNGNLTPKDVTAKSLKRVWWKCDKGPDHEWEAKIWSRTTQRRNCPFCAGKQISITNSLSNKNPGITKEWHPQKNGVLSPNKISAGSAKKVWWKCPNGDDHEWQATVGNRTKTNGSKCPYCAGMKLSKTNSLHALFPDLALEWHPTMNGNLTPKDVVAGTNKKYWWKCNKHSDHEWQAVMRDRINGSGCPCCCGRKASCKTNLTVIFPEIATQFHSTKNGNLDVNDIPIGSHTKLWWKCPNGDDHEWQATIEI